jgi:hypothetical protein
MQSAVHIVMHFLWLKFKVNLHMFYKTFSECIPDGIHSLIKSTTLYSAATCVINPLVGRRRAAAVAHLEDVVTAQLQVAEAEGQFRCFSFR